MLHLGLLHLVWVISICCLGNAHSSCASAGADPGAGGHARPRPPGQCTAHSQSILVVGSINVDITMEVSRLPRRGETITARSPSTALAVGGKGANTAVAAARISGGGVNTSFVCRFGNDAHAAMLEAALVQHGVDVSGSGHSSHLPSGQGMVMLEEDGSVSSVVVGGSNTAWPQQQVDDVVRRAGCADIVLLQREIPEQVNEAVAAAAAAAGVPVLQDVGGEDRPISDALLPLLTFIVPNESELSRLTGLPTGSEERVVEAARQLQSRGARHVLVTLGDRGSLLLMEDGRVLRQYSCPVPGGLVLDATGAGDAFRAAFAVSLVEGRHTLQESLRFASVAGAIAASRLGAVPSLPSRQEVDQLLQAWNPADTGPEADPGPSSGWMPETAPAAAVAAQADLGTPGSPPPLAAVDSSGPELGAAALFPMQLKFASRLNSLKERPELWDGALDVLGLVQRQGAVRGLGLVDFNFPQHLQGLAAQQVRDALRSAGLQAGAVCIRFPPDMRLGAFSNPDPAVRSRAVELAVAGCQWARELSSRELIVWSAYDGYDYHLQVDYVNTWQRVVESFQQVCDACPDLLVSIEFKPTDENSRYSVVPSTGAALLLAQQVNRSNMGLTLDLGHLLMAGENPAQSLAMVASAGKLFGLQLGDGHPRLGAEDGLAFAGANPRVALELIFVLQQSRYEGHVYFDTFPRNEDPVREAEHNIRMFKALWKKALQLREAGVGKLLLEHDALSVLELELELLEGMHM